MSMFIGESKKLGQPKSAEPKKQSAGPYAVVRVNVGGRGKSYGDYARRGGDAIPTSGEAGEAVIVKGGFQTHTEAAVAAAELCQSVGTRTSEFAYGVTRQGVW